MLQPTSLHASVGHVLAQTAELCAELELAHGKENDLSVA